MKFEKGDRIDKILKKQLRDFRKKFGRDPGAGDPIFFDPDADTPQPIPQAAIDATMRQVAEFLPPQIAYAYLKTGGLLLTEENYHLMSDEDLAEWNAAVDEYHRLQGEQEDDPN